MPNEEFAALLNSASQRWRVQQPTPVVGKAKTPALAAGLSFVFVILSGRVGRRFYWASLAVVGLIVAAAIPFPQIQIMTVAITGAIWNLVSRGRLRDMGRPPMWALFVFILAMLIAPTGALLKLSLYASFGLGGLVVLGFSIWLGVAPGDAGTNLYGQPPGGEDQRMRTIFS